MADPSRIYANLPQSYDARPSRGLYQLLSGLAAALSSAQTSLDDFIGDLTVVSADGEGLDRAGEGLAVPRIPGLGDAQYAILIRTRAPCARGTIQAIRSVFEAATGLSGVVVRDWHTHSLLGIPPYEIWIYVNSDSDLYGSYADADTPPAAAKANHNAPWPPQDSCYLGCPPQPAETPPVAQSWNHDAYNLYGGEYNDHWWSPVDVKTQEVIDSVKLAGTIIVYKYV